LEDIDEPSAKKALEKRKQSLEIVRTTNELEMLIAATRDPDWTIRQEAVASSNPELAYSAVRDIVVEEVTKVVKGETSEFSVSRPYGTEDEEDLSHFEIMKNGPKDRELIKVVGERYGWVPKDYDEVNKNRENPKMGYLPPDEFLKTPAGWLAHPSGYHGKITEDYWYWRRMNFHPDNIGNMSTIISEVICPYHWLEKSHQVMYIPFWIQQRLCGQWVQCGYCGKWSFFLRDFNNSYSSGLSDKGK